MARNPCSNCRNTSGGRLAYWYLMGWDGERPLKYRLRLCSPCAETLISDLLSIGDMQDVVGRWVPPEAQI